MTAYTVDGIRDFVDQLKVGDEALVVAAGRGMLGEVVKVQVVTSGKRDIKVKDRSHRLWTFNRTDSVRSNGLPQRDRDPWSVRTCLLCPRDSGFAAQVADARAAHNRRQTLATVADKVSRASQKCAVADLDELIAAAEAVRADIRSQS
ncbi:MAG: hypothetical protein WAV90_18125 [Gordonia amarae]